MDTWAKNKHVTTLDNVKEALLPFLQRADGVTISGGEPFDQPEALLALLQWLRKNHSGDHFVYTGYAWEQIQNYGAQFDGLIDALMADRFRQDISQTIALRGSDNQRLLMLTKRGKERFASYDRDVGPQDRTLDVMFDERSGEVFMAGIPARGDLQLLVAKMKADGHKVTMTADFRQG